MPTQVDMSGYSPSLYQCPFCHRYYQTSYAPWRDMYLGAEAVLALVLRRGAAEELACAECCTAHSKEVCGEW